MFGTGVSAAKEYHELLELIRTALINGITGFDTAPSYGTEEILAKAIWENARQLQLERKDFYIQTKIDAWQMQERNGNIRGYVEDVMMRMNISYLDSLLIHWPIPEYFETTWKAFVELQESKLVNKIGICNLRIRQLKELEQRGLLPQILQIERHPLFICESEIEFCKQNNITVQAYSPLCKMNEKIRDSVELKCIADKYQKNIGQIVLRWHLDTGVIPIFTSRRKTRVQEYADILDFQLTDSDIRRISALNMNYKMYLESFACPGF